LGVPLRVGQLSNQIATLSTNYVKLRPEYGCLSGLLIEIFAWHQ